jgi:hypothetical protein
MTGRIGDTITDPILTRCEGCGQTALMCECSMDHDSAKCCGVCTHRHAAATLTRYGLFDS